MSYAKACIAALVSLTLILTVSLPAASWADGPRFIPFGCVGSIGNPNPCEQADPPEQEPTVEPSESLQRLYDEAKARNPNASVVDWLNEALERYDYASGRTESTVSPLDFFVIAGTSARVSAQAIRSVLGANAAHLLSRGLYLQVGNVGVDLAPLARSGRQLDPADRGGKLTYAGRALQKHGQGQRPNEVSPFPAVRGNPQNINRIGQQQLDEILSHPQSAIVRGSGRRNSGVDIVHPDGRIARFDEFGNMVGFRSGNIGR
jgi:hypothetical protein